MSTMSSGLAINATFCKHAVEVLHTSTGAPIIIIF